MFKRIRIAVLLYVLLCVAVGTYLSRARSTDWNAPLWINVYAAPAGDAPPASAAPAALEPRDVAAMETFFAAEARKFGVPLERPFRFHAAGAIDAPLPALGESAGVLDAVLWSLRMRWRVAQLDWAGDAPTPDIVLFVIHHARRVGAPVERSGALRNGLIAVAHVIDDRAAAASNRVVIAHELLHTLGATDKYDLATNQPLYPLGYAEPERRPLYPQRRAELMGGRIPLSASEAVIPADLADVVVGRATAFEIGWLETRPDSRRSH